MALVLRPVLKIRASSLFAPTTLRRAIAAFLTLYPRGRSGIIE
jgi:hypothetical protein